LSRVNRSALLLVLVAASLALGAAYSYFSDGLVHALVSGPADQGPWLHRLREYLRGWGSLAPIVYTLAVVIEVLVAPIPGTLLYAPAGAIFGGFLGGSLSLLGNVIGAALACVLGRTLGERALAERLGSGTIGQYRDVLKQHGLWIVLLLRLNPLTTSDLVPYAAGIVGVRAWKAAVGTLVGLAPWCYLQAYLAEQLFELLPGWAVLAVSIVLLIGLAAPLLLSRPRGISAAE
jgi:uncharacterized membrane protein YdjX (TVP38/TMEM64 family)